MNCARDTLFVAPDLSSSLLSVQVEGSILITSVGSPVLWRWLVYLVGSRSLERGRRERSGDLLLRLPPCRLPSAACVLHPRAAGAIGPSSPGFSSHAPSLHPCGPRSVTSPRLLHYPVYLPHTLSTPSYVVPSLNLSYSHLNVPSVFCLDSN